MIFLYNEELENQIKQVKKMLHLSMNGAVSESMSSSGLEYGLNYGVQLPRIKELASSLPQNALLAQRLWFSNCREMMLMAALVQPVESFDLESALKWVAECHNMELVEQLCLNLFRKMDKSDDLLHSLIHDDRKYVKAAAYVLASFLCRMDTLTADAESDMKSVLEADVFSPDYVVYSSVARFLRVLAEQEREFVEKFLSGLDDAQGGGVAYVKDNVRTVLMY